MALVIDDIWGHAPVQAKGSVNGKTFYFRARHRHWSMAIGVKSDEDDEKSEWYRESEHPNPSWMEHDEAKAIIETCAADYAAGKPA